MKIFVLGSGGWGSALAILLHNNGHCVTMWTFFKEECERLQKERANEKLLPGVKIPEGIEITNDMAGAAAADLVVMAVPEFRGRFDCRKSCGGPAGGLFRSSTWARVWTPSMATAASPRPLTARWAVKTPLWR